ncbi:ABC transporter ATP-binding protein [Lederbergia lenta]|uniref:Putative ABC transporter ATP-binding protein n=1 Tax=Lederbergia lenta TaxID=1467 RepID=A0A2X4VQ70_LEDLE|nr:ATP-binding cassette domain-containing protein [Lederbergia lenta]MEC2323633.1 ATP-binding cassette domain-containing protein [Lederbergia lenta]SQI52389.1 putative ABC transporter ATP-binding protein [Lederbergia lenta]
MKNILELETVSKKVRGKYLIRNVSLEVEKGTICGLLGPNGAGKTTIIRMLTGLIRPTAGDILIHEQSVVKNREFALRNVGAIVESPIFFPYMTGRENLKNLVRLHDNIPKREANEKVSEVLQITGIEHRAEEKVRTYSLGMKQRLGIAQALLGDPELLILDEPANGLDPMGMRELRELILTLKNKYSKTILISSHLLDELQKICNQIVIIREGELVWTGELDNEQNLEDIFIELVSK